MSDAAEFTGEAGFINHPSPVPLLPEMGTSAEALPMPRRKRDTESFMILGKVIATNLMFRTPEVKGNQGNNP